MNRGASPPGEGAAKQFEEMVALYLKTNPWISGAKYQTKNVPELEIRFGTQAGKHPLARSISNIDYENVVKALYSAGFAPLDGNTNGLHILRIQNEYYDRKMNRQKLSNIRAEVAGMDLIQEYCRTNSLPKLLDMPAQANAKSDKIKFTQKRTAFQGSGAEAAAGNFVKPVDFPDWGFRVSYQNETYFSPRSDATRNILADWANSKKTFRYLNRVRFAHPDLPFFVDLSIVKTSKTTHRIMVPQYTVQDAGVFTNPETYEVELEVDNQRMGERSLREVMGILRRGIRLILGALQETKYPIGLEETSRVLLDYLTLTQQDAQPGAADPETWTTFLARRDAKVVLPKYFLGPSSYTLQMENLVPYDPAERLTPNIRNHYTVTDKADGERRLLFVPPNGRMYMITPAMHVIFTGAMVIRTTRKKGAAAEEGRDADLYNTILDGEYITHDKQGDPLSLYMAFDAYFVRGKSVRKEGFYPLNVEDRAKGNFRFMHLDAYLQALELRPVTADPAAVAKTAPTSLTPIAENAPLCGIILQKKNFYVASASSGHSHGSSADDPIFAACAELLAKIDQGYFPYNTDGIIFTPASMGVGADRIGEASRPQKITWAHSFKWKPPEYNTIDFLVTVQHDKRGQEEVRYLYEPGQSLLDGAQTLTQYKTLILKCGYDPKDHRNPYNDVLHGRLPSGHGERGSDNEEKYKPVVFQPTDPYDPNACFCHVALRDVAGKEGVMVTEEGDYFEANMIVEFRYDLAREGSWKWVPLRVRYDKTAELRAGMHNYGNSFHVANNNWTSIHEPITRGMLTTGEGIPDRPTTQNDVYYNRKTKDTNTQALRNFHNLYVKRRLIEGVSQPGQQLMDFACGKAGDLSKWYASRLKFVLGLDVSRDNIHNTFDGACARYLGECKKHGEANMPRCLFFVGDSGKNIRHTGDAFASTTERGYVKAIFGQGDKDPQGLPPAVFQAYGVGEPGFDVGSCQFAIHYFFENEVVLHSFLRNVSDCIRVGGYFIGTTYDGQTVFDRLRKKPKGGAWTLMKNGTKIAEIVKDYDEDTFPETEMSLGFRIQVYQETINQVFPEYLVNFKYLTQMMEMYGFQLVTNDEAQKMGMPAGTGTFEELYTAMMQEVRRGKRSTQQDYGAAADMSEDEKKISFLNRYFIFKKIHTVHTENLGKIVQNRVREIPSPPPPSATSVTTSAVPPENRSRKLKTKMVLKCPAPGTETATA